MSIPSILGILLFISVAGNALLFHVHTSYIETTSKQIASLESANKTSLETVNRLKEEIEENKKVLTEVTEDYVELDAKFRETENELENYKSREKVLLKRPELMQRRINSASDRVFRSFYCETGGICRKDRIPSSKTSSTEPASPGNESTN